MFYVILYPKIIKNKKKSLPLQTMLASRNDRNFSLNSGTDSPFDGDGGGL